MNSSLTPRLRAERMTRPHRGDHDPGRDRRVGEPARTGRRRRVPHRGAAVTRTALGARMVELDVVGRHLGGRRQVRAQHGVHAAPATTGHGDHGARTGVAELDDLSGEFHGPNDGVPRAATPAPRHIPAAAYRMAYRRKVSEIEADAVPAPPSKPGPVYGLVRGILRPLVRLIYRPTITGTEHVPRHGAVILASNHLSFVDSIVIPLAAPRPVQFLAKSHYFTGKGLKGWVSRTFFTAIGAVGATVFAALHRRLDLRRLFEVGQETVKVTAMVFAILVGAALFSLVFRGFGGDELVHGALTALPGGKWGAIVAVMLLMFVLGFVLDFIEIVFVVVPIVGPVLLALGVDPVWLGVMMAINLQTSFLTPPFGFALFYLRGVAPPGLATGDIYRGVLPFIGLQLLMLALVACFPSLATGLPDWLYR